MFAISGFSGNYMHFGTVTENSVSLKKCLAFRRIKTKLYIANMMGGVIGLDAMRGRKWPDADGLGVSALCVQL